MRKYWQRRPLLVRSALEDFSPPIGAQALFELARRDDVESRLVTSFDGWDLRRGPIARHRLPPRGKRGWTLLVQGVDLHDDRAAALLARFRFVADARLDDLMVSYASDGGGVGPHIDDYDVFLLQAQGQRRWRIGNGDRNDVFPELPLKVLRRFEPEHEWLLGPGDLLYLPPGLAHEGTAVGGSCLTCSIGFRAPTWRELLEPWFDTTSARPAFARRYTDPGVAPTSKPARVPGTFIDAALAALLQARPTRADARAMLLTLLTEPKAGVVFERSRRPLAASELRVRARRRGLRLDRRTRMLYSGASLAINGELLDGAGKELALMFVLADQRELTPQQTTALGAAWWGQLGGWHAAGWLHLA